MVTVNEQTIPSGETKANRTMRAACLVWGVLLGIVVCRHFITLDDKTFFENHDHDGYLLRLVEFRDCLSHGYIFPQWCSHFRGGLGSPFFNFYQPGFFYSASIVPSSVAPAVQVGLTLLAYSIVGYIGMFLLVATRFGDSAGLVAGTCFLTAPYISTELYIRGDFSEYTALMCVPLLLHALLHSATVNPARMIGLGCASASLVVISHPAVALATYGSLALVLTALFILGSGESRRIVHRGVLILACGAGMSAFYWIPLFWELKYVSASKAWSGEIFDGYYHYSNHFIQLASFFDRTITKTPIPVKLGMLHWAVTAIAIIVAGLSWKQWNSGQRRVVAIGGFLAAASLFLMTPQSVWIWETVPLLDRIQFPWRLLTLVSIGMAAVAGSVMFAIQRPAARWLTAAGISGLLLFVGAARPGPPPLRFVGVRSADEIAHRFFSPDLADEWLPADARRLPGDPTDLRPVGGESVSVSDFRLQQGIITCEVVSKQASRLLIPHYSFPIGFTATLNDQPVAIGRNEQGLMLFEIPENFSGTLRIEWSTTPAKWFGCLVTLLSILAVSCYLRFRKAPLTQDDGPPD